MRYSHLQIVSAAAIAFLCAWMPGAARLHALQRDIHELSSSTVEIRQEIASAQAELESLRQKFASEEVGRDKWLALEIHAENLATKAHPESQWATPPEGEPTWDPGSPYIWLHKENLGGLQFKSMAFTASGEVTDRMAAVLALDENQRTELNEKLRTLLESFQSSAAVNVRPVADLPPEIASLPGAKMGIDVDNLLETNLRFQELYLATLEASLGEQCAALISGVAKDRLALRFQLTAGAPATIAVIRNPNRSFNITVRSGGNSTQTTGIPSLTSYLPPYLLPLFASLGDN